MDGYRFDGITKRFVADSGSRRSVLSKFAAILVGAPALATAKPDIGVAASDAAGGRCGPRRTRCGKRCCPRDAPICCGKKRCCQMHEVCGRKSCIRK